MSKINHMSETTRNMASLMGLSAEQMQADVMARARVDTAPWLVCNECVVHFLSTAEEKAKAHALAIRLKEGQELPMELLPSRSSLLKGQERPMPRSRRVTCRKCLKEVEYVDNLVHCPFCMSPNPIWPLAIVWHAPDRHPGRCVICTSLSSDDIDVQWTAMVLQITLGTLLGMQQRSDIRSLFVRLQARGFEFNVMTDIPQADIESGRCDAQAKQSVDLPTGGEPVSCVAVTMLEPIRHRGLLRFCFYLKSDEPAAETEIDPFF